MGRVWRETMAGYVIHITISEIKIFEACKTAGAVHFHARLSALIHAFYAGLFYVKLTHVRDI